MVAAKIAVVILYLLAIGFLALTVFIPWTVQIEYVEKAAPTPTFVAVDRMHPQNNGLVPPVDADPGDNFLDEDDLRFRDEDDFDPDIFSTGFLSFYEELLLKKKDEWRAYKLSMRGIGTGYCISNGQSYLVDTCRNGSMYQWSDEECRTYDLDCEFLSSLLHIVATLAIMAILILLVLLISSVYSMITDPVPEVSSRCRLPCNFTHMLHICNLPNFDICTTLMTHISLEHLLSRTPSTGPQAPVRHLLILPSLLRNPRAHHQHRPPRATHHRHSRRAAVLLR